MTRVKRFGALLFALGVFAASVAPTALGDPPGPGDKQCRPGKQNPHCPSSPK